MAGLLDYFLGQTQLSPEKQQALDAQSLPAMQYPGQYPDIPEMRRAGNLRDAAIARVPIAPLELISLLGLGVDTVRQPSQDEDGNNLGVLDRLGRAKYGAGDGFTNIQQNIQDSVTRIMGSGDTRDPKEIAREYVQSPAFKEYERSQMPFFRRGVANMGDAIDRSLGAPTDDEKTIHEQAQTAIGQAAVPATWVGKLNKALGGNRATELAADMLVAGSSPHTGKNIAINAAVGGAATYGLDAAIDHFSKDDEDPSVPPEPPSTDERASSIQSMLPSFAEASMAAMGMAAAVAAPKAAKQAADDVVEGVIKRGRNGKIIVDGGEANPEKLAVSPVARSKLDELAPVQDTLERHFEDKAKATEATRAYTQHLRANAHESVEHWRTHGIVENMDRPILSGNQLRAMADELNAAGELGNFNQYMLAGTALDSRNNQMKLIQRDLDEHITAITSARQNGELKKLSELEKGYAEALQKKAAFEKDLQEGRPSLNGLSYDDLEMVRNHGAANELYQKMEKTLRQFSDDWLEVFQKNGILSADDVKAYKEANPNYVPLMSDPHYGKTGLDRFMSVLRDRLGRNENPYGDPGDFIRSFTAFKSRDLFNEQTVNKAVNPFDAFDVYAERAIRFVNREKFKSAFIDDLKAEARSAEQAAMKTDTPDAWRNVQTAKAKVAKEVEQFEVNGQTQFTVDQIKALTKADVFHGDSFPVSRLVNGKVEFYRFRDPLVHTALQQMPLNSWPIFRDVSRIFRQFTTGSANPGFAPVNFGYDTFTANTLRPVGSLYGTDYLVNKATLGQSPAWLNNVIRVATTSFDPGAYFLNVATALNLWRFQNAKRIAGAAADDLASNSTFFGAIAKAPGGKELLQAVSEHMTLAFSDGLYNTLTTGKVAGLAEFENIRTHVRDIDKFWTGRIPEWAKVVGSPAHELFQQYRMMMSSINNAARVGYVMRNQHMFTNASGTVDKAALKKVMTDARTLTGDVARKPGSPALQGYDSAAPYTNIMLRATQNMWQRMRDDKRVMAVALSGAIMPKLFSDTFMSNWDKEAYDYYWREMPDWKRVSTIIVPSTQLIAAWAKGESPAFSRDLVNEINIFPEMRAITTAVSEGVRALGIYGAGQKDPLTGGQTAGSMLSVIGEAMKQSFAPMVPPLMQGLAAVGGVKMDIGNMYQLPSAVANGNIKQASPFQPSGAPGAATRMGTNDTLNVGSKVDQTLYDVIAAMIGTTGTRLTQAFDTGVQNFEKDGKLLDALFSAGKEVVQRTAELKSDVPLIGGASEKVYRGSPVSKQALKMREAVSLSKQIVMAKGTGEPMLDQIAANLNMVARGNAEYKGFTKQYYEFQDQLKAIEANRKLSYHERLKMRNEILQKLHAQDVQQGRFLNDLQKTIADQIGGDYKHLYGTDFNFGDFSTRIKAAMRKKKAALPLQ